MQRRIILLLLIVIATVAAGGCMVPELPEGLMDPLSSPTPAPVATETRGPAPDHPVRYEMEFVDPEKYHIPTPTPTVTLIEPPDDVRISEKMVVYATATNDSPDFLATDTYHIPFPYWNLTVRVSTEGENPYFDMDVRDARDPNRIVKLIRYTEDDKFKSGGSMVVEETFAILEGYRDYYFTVCSKSIRSLSITIEVPEKYLI